MMISTWMGVQGKKHSEGLEGKVLSDYTGPGTVPLPNSQSRKLDHLEGNAGVLKMFWLIVRGIITSILISFNKILKQGLRGSNCFQIT